MVVRSFGGAGFAYSRIRSLSSIVVFSYKRCLGDGGGCCSYRVTCSYFAAPVVSDRPIGGTFFGRTMDCR